MSIKTIMVKNHGMIRMEEQVAGAYYPGMLLEEDSNGYYQPHSTSGGNVEPLVGIEDELSGGNVSTVYVVGRRGAAVYCRPGDEVQLRLANGQSASRNDLLESNGDGYVKVHTPTVDSSQNLHTEYLNAIKFKALEAVDMSDSSAADPSGLIRARCIG